MDSHRFDVLTRSFDAPASRRNLVLTGGSLTALAASVFGWSGVDAERRRHKRKKKQTRCESATCTPNCVDRACGRDGCGGSCGNCGANQICQGGTCCVPDPPSLTCAGRCGTWSNNCGQPVTCATCPAGQQCLSNGSCAVVCSQNTDCPGCGGCSNPDVDGLRHCIENSTNIRCASTTDCAPGHHCQDFGAGGFCTPLCA